MLIVRIIKNNLYIKSNLAAEVDLNIKIAETPKQNEI